MSFKNLGNFQHRISFWLCDFEMMWIWCLWVRLDMMGLLLFVGWLPWDSSRLVTQIVCPGDEIRVSPVSLPLSSTRVLMETRIPGGPHIKTRGIAALGFQTNITHFLCCLRDRGHGGLSPEDLPRYRLPPAHRPIPQEPLKANVSQGEGVAFLQEVN